MILQFATGAASNMSRMLAPWASSTGSTMTSGALETMLHGHAQGFPDPVTLQAPIVTCSEQCSCIVLASRWLPRQCLHHEKQLRLVVGRGHPGAA
jgi:hypothetical protein